MRRLKSEVFPDSEDKKERKLSRKNDLIVWLPLSEGQVSPLNNDMPFMNFNPFIVRIMMACALTNSTFFLLSHLQEKLYRAFLNSNTAEETLSTGTKVLSALTVSDI